MMDDDTSIVDCRELKWCAAHTPAGIASVVGGASEQMPQPLEPWRALWEVSDTIRLGISAHDSTLVHSTRHVLR